MKNISKPFAAFLGLAMMATTPLTANAAPYRSNLVLSQGDSIVTEVQRRRRPRRRSSRRHRRNRGVAAGVIGAIILGGIIAESNRRRYRRSARRDRLHIDWCYDRYRSYRAYDNSFQPYDGPRRPCFSPFY